MLGSRAIAVQPLASESLRYSVNVSGAAFVLTGIAVTLSHVRKLTAAVHAFTFTGIAVTLTRAKVYFLTIGLGIFLLTGFNVLFPATRKLTATVGAFVMGTPTTILTRAKVYVFGVLAGAYSLVGITTTRLSSTRTRAVATGAFFWTGIFANLFASRAGAGTASNPVKIRLQAPILRKSRRTSPTLS